MAARRRPVRIGIVAGEVSGDLLGAGLIRALKKRLPEVRFEGVCGERMEAEGCRSMFPMEWLSIFGLVEAVGKYPQIQWMRRDLIKHFLSDPPDLFIGVDVPDFNLGLEKRLRRAGIATVHYVSPTVWAWRSYRIHKIKKAVDRMLTLFPFEARYYEQHQLPVTFVGHPLADQIDDSVDQVSMRGRLGLPKKNATVIALLPGSRANELKRHGRLFVETALWLYRRNPTMHFVVPLVNSDIRAMFEDAIAASRAEDLPITRLDGQSRDAMAAADVVLLASGTAALEAALLRRLMVVTYKVSLITYLLITSFAHVKLFSLPNNLLGREVVPELIQQDAVPEKLGTAVEYYLTHPEKAQSVGEELREIGVQLRRNANERAAEAVLEVLKTQSGRP
ncbi:MAG: lipid-A-disaccharide synthase [Acidiferrobacterales bacterium]